MLFGTLSKNAREELRVEYTLFNGHHLLAFRVWAHTGDDGWKPTKKGITVRVAMLPDLLRCLSEADKQLRAKGLLSDG